MRTLLREALAVRSGATVYSSPVPVCGGERLRMGADVVGMIGETLPSLVTVQIQESDGARDWVDLSGASVMASRPSRSEVCASTGSTAIVVRLKYRAVGERTGVALVAAGIDTADL